MTYPYLGPSYQYRHCVEGCSVADAMNAKSDQSARDLRSRYENADAGPQRAEMKRSRDRASIFPAPSENFPLHASVRDGPQRADMKESRDRASTSPGAVP
mmetsp:Transcript_30017/g.71416  ORF Transcript_30017/g.71416 Transcript_30017/m.71416 type:complete len:100 (-) Transcript_30017:115-414(-)